MDSTKSQTHLKPRNIVRISHNLISPSMHESTQTFRTYSHVAHLANPTLSTPTVTYVIICRGHLGHSTFSSCSHNSVVVLKFVARLESHQTEHTNHLSSTNDRGSVQGEYLDHQKEFCQETNFQIKKLINAALRLRITRKDSRTRRLQILQT